MKNLKLSFIFLFVTFFCVANSNPLLGFFGKRSDEKVEEGESDDKAAISIPTGKSVSETTTTTTAATPEPGSSCGGLKNFLHICNKNEPTEPPKSIKTRSVPEKDSDESSDENDSDDDDDDDDDSDESRREKEKKRETTETTSVVSEPVEGGIVKRQVGDPEAPVLGEVPPVIMEHSEEPIENPEEDKAKEKRQVEDSNSNSNSDEDKTEEILTGSRRRRDCTDRNGYYGKNCRRKRELVPSCFDWGCKSGKATSN